MTHLLAIIAFALATIFYAWHLSHGVWAWPFFTLLGFLLESVSHHEKWPY